MKSAPINNCKMFEPALSPIGIPTAKRITPIIRAIISISPADIQIISNFYFNPFKTSAQRAVPIDNRNTTIQSTTFNVALIGLSHSFLEFWSLTGNFCSQAVNTRVYLNSLNVFAACDIHQENCPGDSGRVTGESLNYGKQDGSSYGDEDSNDYSAGSEPAASSISSKLSGDGI